MIWDVIWKRNTVWSLTEFHVRHPRPFYSASFCGWIKYSRELCYWYLSVYYCIHSSTIKMHFFLWAKSEPRNELTEFILGVWFKDKIIQIFYLVLKSFRFRNTLFPFCERQTNPASGPDFKVANIKITLDKHKCDFTKRGIVITKTST